MKEYLLSLMVVVAGFQGNGLFDAIGRKLLLKIGNTAQFVGALVLLCFLAYKFRKGKEYGTYRTKKSE